MNIVHVFRSPVGGLFRHVRDLVRAQHAQGCRVGVICDAGTGGENAVSSLKALAAMCALGVHRIAMHRAPGIGDVMSARAVQRLCAPLDAGVLHGHGAKGGVYARLSAARLGAVSCYTPHGGSMHYSWASLTGPLFLSAEKLLLARTGRLVFVCEYEKKTFAGKIGLGGVPSKVVHNGLWPEEFTPVPPVAGATDIIYIGELRKLKGVDVLIKAISRLHKQQLPVTASIVGDGPDCAEFKALSARLNLAGHVTFPGAMPAGDAFGLGRLMVIPSRAESFPYIVLEAIAAHKPLIASAVGGIPEILSPDCLVAPGDEAALASAISASLAQFEQATARAVQRAAVARTRSSAAVMGREITSFYQ